MLPNCPPIVPLLVSTMAQLKITTKTTKAELLTIVSSLQSETEIIKAERTIVLGLATLAAIFWLPF
jgi:hypothetical protein